MNPDFRSPAGHLLYARALEARGQHRRKRWRNTACSLPPTRAPRPRCATRSCSQAQGQRTEAQKVARELLEQARIAPGHYRRAQRDWLDAARRLL